ncbi:MAG: hypothetical protein MJK04_19835, partial [Psychrosphaera sp.]|nr:hypothetical protein [Psychrosphaera sp.]
EPMTRALGLNHEQVLPDFSKVVEKLQQEDLSFVAIDQASCAIVGVVVNKDYTVAPVAEDLMFSAAKPIFTLVDELDVLATELADVKPKEVFHLYILAVQSDTAGQSVGQQLVTKSFNLAIDLGYKKIATEATGPISQHIAGQKFGAREVAKINYRDFEFEGKKVFATITEVESCLLLIKDFA